MMNKRIAILREVVTKVTKLLAGKGIKVTQQGAQAYVRRNREGVAECVNIPHIADDATEDFIVAIQGFIDHEVGHVLFTNGPVRVAHNGSNPKLEILWNIVEDPMIERLMGKQFPGAAHNIEQLCAYFVEKITTPALKKVKGKNMATFQILIVPCIRAMSGQRIFHEFMTAGGHYANPLIKLMIDKMKPETKARLPFISTTAEACAIADELYAIIHPKPIEIEADEVGDDEGEDDATTFDTAVIKDPPPSKGKGEGETGEGESKEHDGEKETEGGAGEGDLDGDDEREGSGPGDRREREDREPGAGDNHDADDDGDRDSDEADAGEPRRADGDATDGDEASSAAKSGDGEGAAASGEDLEGEDADGSEQDGDAGAGAGSSAGDHEDAGENRDADGVDGEDADDGASREPGEEPEGEDGDLAASERPLSGGVGSGYEAPKARKEESTPFHEEQADLSEADLAAALGELITEIATKSMKREPYRVFTTDFDQVTPYVPRTTDSNRIARMDDAVKHLVGPMQKEMERLVAARSQRLRVPGFRSGRLDAANLHRLSSGDTRVFRRTHEIKAKNTAVSLVVDLSGSMEGAKLETAAKAAYAVSLTLDRLNVPHEVLGFTTVNPTAKECQALQEEEERIGKAFTRWEAILMPIFKQFQERFNPTVKRRFAEMSTGIDTRNNIDGESIAMAARRLATRPEERKILMVFSDGEPYCSSRFPDAVAAHLKKVVEEIEQSGIETIGIGIESRAVASYYPKHVVLRSVAELPKAVMGELKKVLLAA